MCCDTTQVYADAAQMPGIVQCWHTATTTALCDVRTHLSIFGVQALHLHSCQGIPASTLDAIP